MSWVDLSEERRAPGLIDVHAHMVPAGYPKPPSEAAAPRWPCMRCSGQAGTIFFGERRFRDLDSRSWDHVRRLDDMARDGVAVQVLSPMPELLSYWLPQDDARMLCDHVNHGIADMVARAPQSFSGLGAVPLQSVDAAIRYLEKIKTDFGFLGVELGSNIEGRMLGDPAFHPFYEAAEALGMAIFVHALHPVATAQLGLHPAFTTFAGFPLDVALAGASLLTAGIPERFPHLRIALSHGGGGLVSMLGRLDVGWARSKGYGTGGAALPSAMARRFFYDSNVYDAGFLRLLAEEIAPGQVFLGTDYPFDIMQADPAGFLSQATIGDVALGQVRRAAALRYFGLCG